MKGVPQKEAAAAADGGGIDVDRALLLPGLVVLALLVPVGVLFGLLSTGRLIRRVERLADGTARMAGGDLASRVPVSGDDEIGRLEQGFNAMAAAAGGAPCRWSATPPALRRGVAERTRIARELHDSVSQHLFSLNLLAGGLRRALPPGSELRRQTGVDGAHRGPHDARDAGDAAGAAAGRAGGRRARGGAGGAVPGLRGAVSASASRPTVDDAAWTRRSSTPCCAWCRRRSPTRPGTARPTSIELSVAEVQGHVVVAISDEGRGFDPARAGERHGMGLELMRERVGELGGTVDVASAPARGTTVRVRIPAGAS